MGPFFIVFQFGEQYQTYNTFIRNFSADINLKDCYPLHLCLCFFNYNL